MSPAPLSASALAQKYRALLELRRDTARATRERLRQLATEFPGALRELDCLPLAELEHRSRIATAVAEGSRSPAWFQWLADYHARMRLALAIQRRLGAAEPRDFERIARAVASESGQAVSALDVAAVAAPPEGRLNSLILAGLELTWGVSALDLERALFPKTARGPMLSLE